MSPAGTVGIVLVGGGSSRLAAAGLPPGGKAAVELEGRSFLERIVATVAAEVDRVLVVAAGGQPVPGLPPGVEIVRDREAAGGPLAAIRDGLAAAGRLRPAPRLAFVCAGDVPLLRRELVRLVVDRGLAAGADWTVPDCAGHPQVLLSAVALDLLPRIETYLAAGRRDVRGLLAALECEPAARIVRLTAAEVAAVDPAGDSARDVDTPEDLAAVRRRGIPPSSA